MTNVLDEEAGQRSILEDLGRDLKASNLLFEALQGRMPEGLQDAFRSVRAVDCKVLLTRSKWLAKMLHQNLMNNVWLLGSFQKVDWIVESDR